jgi:alanine racemase
MQTTSHHSTWVEVDLGVVEKNIRSFVGLTDAQVMAVVKANGYGHGALPVAQAALRGGATWCGVARLSEALELRAGGLDCPILLLGLTTPPEMEHAVQSHIHMTVWSVEQIEHAARAAKQAGIPARLHLKVDTGMSRLGVQTDAALELAKCISDNDTVRFEGLFTHLARADENDPETTDRQVRRFRTVLQDLQNAGLKPALIHAANSAATIKRPEQHYDLVRVGIALYGLHPSPETPLPDRVQPALSWKTQLSQVKLLPAGRGVSYGHVYTTVKEERIGTLPVGYADGFRRTSGNEVLVRGVRVSVVGRVCMDQCMVQLDDVPDAAVGDEVVLIGRQADERITAEDVAKRWGTINYEVVCGIGARVPRIYSEPPKVSSSVARAQV